MGGTIYNPLVKIGLIDLLLPTLPTHLLCPCIIKFIEYVGENDKLLYYIDAPSQVHSHVKMF